MRARAFALAALVLAAAGCGGDAAERNARIVDGGTLTVYSSLPQQGPAGRVSRDLVRAERLALSEADGRVGRFRIRFVSLDNALPDTGAWDPGRTAVNARTAVRDPTTIAYLGDAPTEATGVSLPILNEAGILQVSPTNTYVGLTRREGAAAGEPERFYPAGQRTFGRVIPSDHAQAGALAALIAEDECLSVAIVDEADTAVQGIAPAVEQELDALEVPVVATDRLPGGGVAQRALADRIDRAAPDCVLVAAAGEPRIAASLVTRLNAERPAMRFYAPEGLGRPDFLRALGPGAEAQLRLTAATLPADEYPRAAQRFFRAFARRHGSAPAPEAIYGYEAMLAVLHAIDEAGDVGNDRAEVIKQFFGIGDRRSVLGTYDIDDNGDTTLSALGAYRVRDGRLLFERIVRAPSG